MNPIKTKKVNKNKDTKLLKFNKQEFKWLRKKTDYSRMTTWEPYFKSQLNIKDKDLKTKIEKKTIRVKQVSNGTKINQHSLENIEWLYRNTVNKIKKQVVEYLDVKISQSKISK